MTGYPRQKRSTPTNARFPMLPLAATFPHLSMLRGVGFGGKKLRRGAFLLPGTTEAIYEVEGIYELGSQPPGRAERQVITGIGYFEWLRIQDDALNATLRLPLYKKNTTRKWLSIDNLSTLVRFHIFLYAHRSNAHSRAESRVGAHSSRLQAASSWTSALSEAKWLASS